MDESRNRRNTYKNIAVCELGGRSYSTFYLDFRRNITLNELKGGKDNGSKT